MSLDNILCPEIKIDLFGKEYPVKFTLRNFAAMKRKFNISEQVIIQGLASGDVESTIMSLWGSTLIFAPFSTENPLEIAESLDIEKLYNLELIGLQEINTKLCDALLNSMPKVEESTEKKPIAKPKKKKK